MRKNKKRIMVLVFLVGIILISLIIYKKDKLFLTDSVKKVYDIELDSKSTEKMDSNVLVYSDGIFKRIEISNGKISDADNWVQNDFSNFKDFPVLGNLNEQIFALKSKDKQRAIVRISTSPETEVGKVEIKDYVCEKESKSCKETQLLEGEFQGLNVSMNDIESNVVWLSWNDKDNTIIGSAINEERGLVSPIYICDLKKRECANTDNESARNANMPEGSISPSMKKFVVVKHNDEPNVSTGEKWTLVLFDINDVAKPKEFDISSLIDRYEGVAYDSVQSVSWSQTEDKLAIGTSRQIFTFNLENGSAQLVYVSPSNEEGDFYWDTSSLFMTPDAKQIAFVDTDEFYVDEEENLEDMTETNNVLKKIDLENNNKVTAMYQGNGLRIVR